MRVCENPALSNEPRTSSGTRSRAGCLWPSPTRSLPPCAAAGQARAASPPRTAPPWRLRCDRAPSTAAPSLQPPRPSASRCLHARGAVTWPGFSTSGDSRTAAATATSTLRATARTARAMREATGSGRYGEATSRASRMRRRRPTWPAMRAAAAGCECRSRTGSPSRSRLLPPQGWRCPAAAGSWARLRARPPTRTSPRRWRRRTSRPTA